jgi:hypothetical protein
VATAVIVHHFKAAAYMRWYLQQSGVLCIVCSLFSLSLSLSLSLYVCWAAVLCFLVQSNLAQQNTWLKMRAGVGGLAWKHLVGSFTLKFLSLIYGMCVHSCVCLCLMWLCMHERVSYCMLQTDVIDERLWTDFSFVVFWITFLFPHTCPCGNANLFNLMVQGTCLILALNSSMWI